MTPAEVLAGARDVLAERGWSGNGGPYCLVMAVGAAETTLDCIAHKEVGDEALRLLQATTRHPHLTVWNDAPERTYEDVVLALKQAEELACEVSA